MATAGYLSKLYASGASTPFSSEPCTQIGATLSYQINTAAKRVLDPGTVPVVKVGGSPVALSSLTSIDPYFGIVTFAGAPGGAVTVDAAYLPLLAVANLRELNAALKTDVLDVSVNGTSYKKKAYGLADSSGDFTGLDPLVTDLDAGVAGRQSFWDFLQGRTPKLLQYDFDGSGLYVLRVWGVLPSLEAKSDLAAVMTSKVMWEQAAQQAFAAWGVPVADFSFAAP